MSINLDNTIIGEASPLLHQFESLKNEVVSNKHMWGYTRTGIESRRVKAELPGKVFEATVLCSGTYASNVTMAGTAALCGFPLPAALLAASSCFGMIWCSLPVITGLHTNYLMKKIAPIHNPDRKIKKIVDEDDTSLLTYASLSSEYDEKHVRDWCEYLMDRSAVPFTQGEIDEAFKVAVCTNKLILGEFFILKGANSGLILTKDAWFIKFKLKQLYADLNPWYKLLPQLQEQGKLQKRLKIFSHIMDREVEFNNFEGAGLSSRISAKITKKYRLKKLV